MQEKKQLEALTEPCAPVSLSVRVKVLFPRLKGGRRKERQHWWQIWTEITDTGRILSALALRRACGSVSRVQWDRLLTLHELASSSYTQARKWYTDWSFKLVHRFCGVTGALRRANFASTPTRFTSSAAKHGGPKRCRSRLHHRQAPRSARKPSRKAGAAPRNRDKISVHQGS